MGKIITEKVERVIYESSDGRKTPLEDMVDAHLVNAFGQAAQLDAKSGGLSWSTSPSETKKTVNILRAEILRRMSKTI